MKHQLLILTLAACLMAAPAFADTWSGTVAASETAEVTIPSDGTLTSLALEVGQTVHAGDAVGTIRQTKVFAPTDGTIAAIHLEEGDKASGTVLEISPISLYTLTCTTDNYAKTPENALVHSGEVLYVRCTVDGSHRALARVTTISGADFNAEVIGGELYVGESVYLYRQSNFAVESLIGKGTVTTHETLAVTGDGIITELRVSVGDAVEKGQWLFSCASSENTAITIPANGVVTDIRVSAGNAVKEDDTAAVIATDISLRVDVSSDDAGRFQRGGTWYYIRNDDPHEVHYRATVLQVLINESDASATIVLRPEAEQLPIGMGIILTDEME